MSGINQKEYLKKYLSIGSEPGKKKKRKKASKGISNRVKIIDDDVDIAATFNAAVEEDLYGTAEDAPQIVGITDDRPLELRANDYKISEMWKPMGKDEPKVNIKEEVDDSSSVRAHKHRRVSDDDMSPVRTIKVERVSPDRQNRRVRHDSDDASPPRHRKDSSSIRIRTNEDNSPPRRSNRELSEDNSPPRRKNRENDDNSPPRKRREYMNESSLARKESYADNSPPRRKNKGNEDNSPPRRRNKANEDNSPPRRNNRSNADDCSPPRKKNRDKEDLSPARKRKADKDLSPIRTRHRNEDNSPPRRKRDNDRKKSRWNASPENDIRIKQEPQSPDGRSSSSKMTKTLDGKAAGLQNAKELAKETVAFKKREEDLFKKMTAETSGVSANTIVRDRKTGKIRNLEEEAQVAKDKEEVDNKRAEKYAVWGKGVKQVEDLNEKIQQDLHEMSKPLARYADDEDLEEFLKNQEREGDPMLAYMRKKKRKKDIEQGKTVKQVYMGEFMPNRYGIPPGHRWDGVDRSNGYEKRWFENINKRKALQEDSYKWNSEDM